MTVADSYDRVAGEYADRYYRELDGKPFDREVLDRFADRVRGTGPVADLGCGPGQVARYLMDRGVDAVGVDLSPGMVDQARRLNPDARFEVGDLLALPAADGAWAGVVAFYALCHLPADRLPAAFAEMLRVLRPGGLALVSFHIGDQSVRRESWWDKPVSLDFHFFPPDAVGAGLAAAGFAVEEAVERPPYEGLEYPSRRGYVLARKPA